MSPGASGSAGRQPGSSGGNDDLREQVQKLARQVEELRNLVQNKAGEPTDIDVDGIAGTVDDVDFWAPPPPPRHPAD